MVEFKNFLGYKLKNKIIFSRSSIDLDIHNFKVFRTGLNCFVADAWLIFFMVITMLVNCRDHILEINNDREELLARLKRLPGQIEAEDVPDLVTLAQVQEYTMLVRFQTLLL